MSAARPHQAFRTWLAGLFSPRTTGMDDATPAASPWALALTLGLLSLQVTARYYWGFLHDSDWQALHILIGWALCAAVFLAFHGRLALARALRATAPLLALVLLCLAVFWYWGRSDSYRRFFGDPTPDTSSLARLAPFLYFATMATALRLIIPFAFARFRWGIAPRDLGLPLTHPPHARRVRGIVWIYVTLGLVVAPAVVLASHSPAFLAKYPLGRDLIDPSGHILVHHFVVYQAFYFLVFLSGESFWRGFMTLGLERRWGLYALVWMVVPYVTSHFGKPFSETLGAIAAGMTLGFLALRHRSVWWGVALHYGVALSMDLLSIWRNGFAFKL